jgi:hypothetical protein
MGISCAVIQVITPTCYTYTIDCYRVESGEVCTPPSQSHLHTNLLWVSTFFNFVRQEFGVAFAFNAILLEERIGYQFEFIFFACMGSIIAFIPVWC